MVIEFVTGNALESRFNNLLDVRRRKIKLRMVSQHVYEHEINGTLLSKKLELLTLQNAEIDLILNLMILLLFDFTLEVFLSTSLFTKLQLVLWILMP